MLSNLMLRNWSTDLRVPTIDRSFLSSTVTSWSVSVLNTEKMSCRVMQSAFERLVRCRSEAHHVEEVPARKGRRERRQQLSSSRVVLLLRVGEGLVSHVCELSGVEQYFSAN